MSKTRTVLTVFAAVLLFTLLVALISSFKDSVLIIPGFSPTEYARGDDVQLTVNKITSHRTQVPFAWHDVPGVCVPSKEHRQKVHENLGEVLMGDRMERGLYNLTMDNDLSCVIVCRNSVNPKGYKKLTSYIRAAYRVHWSVDGLPSAHMYKTISNEDRLETAWPLGRWNKNVAPTKMILNNHVDIILRYSLSESSKSEKPYRIVYFEIVPDSIDYSGLTGPQVSDRCRRRATLTAPLFDLGHFKQRSVQGEDIPITWTYSVRWIADPVTTWANRWDIYVNSNKGEGQVHWFGIINSLLIVLFLTGMVAMIMLRTLHADFQKYNTTEDPEENETGWKLIHGDVFRAPPRPMLFASLVGSGTQILLMTLITMIFAVLGFLSPANRGLLVTAMVLVFVCMGVVGGYSSTRIFQMFNGEKWQKNTILTATIVPGTVFGVLFFLNLFLWAKHSSASIPFLYLVALVLIWFGISVPLTFVGAYLAWKKEPIQHPVRVLNIPRHIPQQLWYLTPQFSIALGGILPFGAIFIELFFVFSSVWLQQVHYLFSFLFIILVVLILTCSEIAIVMVYFQLCAENHAWWWRAFLTPAASAGYVLLYSLFYLFSTLKISSFVSLVLYVGYSFCMALGVFVVTGAIGYHASFWFVRKMYSSVKFA